MKDLTQGSIPRHVIEMAVPMAVGMLVQTLYFLVDLYFVGRLGDVALAGGVNAIVGPETTVQLSQLRALSPDGRCKTFDHRANGYVRGEGCGMVVLKRSTMRFVTETELWPWSEARRSTTMGEARV